MAIESPADPMVGRMFGPYRVTGRIGTGGMGTVYRAVHAGLDQARAIKTLPSSLAHDPLFVERFSREARTAARLRHPNIVQIYDVGADGGVHFIAMELVTGRPLDAILRIEGRLPVERALHLLTHLAAALDAAHASGVVHRDVKPSNAIVGPNDHLTLVDFGIARALGGTALTGSGVIGTPEYMAPELLRGKDSGPSVDQYALGVVAYELFTGRRPFQATTSPAALLYSQAHEPPPSPRTVRPELPKAVEKVLLRQLAKEPGGRYPTCVGFVESLRAAVGFWASPRPAITPPTGSAQIIASARPPTPNIPRPRTLIPPAPCTPQSMPPLLPSQTLQTPLPPGRGNVPSDRTPIPTPVRGQPGQPAQPARSRGWLPVLAMVGIVGVTVLLGAWFVVRGARVRPSTVQAPATAVVTPSAAVESAATGSDGSSAAVAAGPGVGAKPEITATAPVPTGTPALKPTEPPRPIVKLGGPVPQMREARLGHAATPLNDGQLLVVGGYAGGTSYHASAERYDPGTNTWNSAGRMAEALTDHAATLLANGHVLVTGGNIHDKFSYTANTERYDPVTNAWTGVASMLQKRGRHTATLLPGGKVLVAGGCDGGDVLSAAELYDPASDTWAAAAKMVKERHDFTATLLKSGRVLVVGGWDERAPVGTAELYDPASNSWSPAGKLVAPRRNHTATLLENGQVLVAGGFTNTDGTPVAQAEMFDPATNSWQPAGALSQPRGGHTATLLADGTVLVAGGGVGAAASKTARDFGSAELYRPAMNNWRRLNDMKWAQQSHTAWRLPGGEVLLVGGSSSESGWVAPQLFDPTNSTWIGERTARGERIVPTNAFYVEPVRTLEGHTALVKGTAFSPDGQLIVSGGGDKTVRLWRAGDGSLVRTLEGHTGAIWSVAFSPDGKVVASASEDATVKLWRVTDGALLRTLDDHIGKVYSVAFSPGGEMLVSGADDMSVKLWRVRDGQLMATFEGHAGAVMSVAYSSDGNTIASGSNDLTVKLWSIMDGKLLRTLEGHTKRVMSVAFSTDGTTVLSASGQAGLPVEASDNTIRLWRVSDGAPLKTLTGHTSAVISAAFSPDSQLVASASLDATLTVWRLSDGEPLKVLTEPETAMVSVGFSPDGRYLVSGQGGAGKKNDVKMWAVK